MVDRGESGKWYPVKYDSNLLNRSLTCEVSSVRFFALYFPANLSWWMGVTVESGILSSMFATF